MGSITVNAAQASPEMAPSKTENLDSRMIFMGGAPRSGTTLVQNMLDSHAQIFGGPEFRHLPDIMDLRRGMHKSIDREMIDVFCSREDADAITRTMIKTFLLPAAAAHGARYISEKTPSNALVFPDLMELFPQAFYIFVLRDPRAVAASMLQVASRARDLNQPTKAPKSALAAAREINKYLAIAFDFAKAHPGRVLRVDYTRVVTDAEAVTREVCDFLGVDWDRKMLTPGEISHSGEKAQTQATNNIWYDTKMYNRNPDTGSLEKWRDQLSTRQQAVMALSLTHRDQLRKMGYEIDPTDFSRTDILAAKAIIALDGIKTKARKLARQFF